MSFPVTPLSVTVELAVGAAGAWVDITAYCYTRDPITMHRGRADEASHVQPSSARFTINNRDGRFSPRNPTGPYYGVIGRNTPVRISTTLGALRVRFVGEVSAWPCAWDVDGKDVWTSVEAAGILRRLGQGASPVASAMRRAILSFGSGSPFSASDTPAVAYWPAEDAQGSRTIASGLGGPAMRISGGTPDFSDDVSFAGSAALPVLHGAVFSGAVPTYAAPTPSVQVRFLLAVSVAQPDNTVLAQIYCTSTRWDVVYSTSSGGSLTVWVYDADGRWLTNSFDFVTGLDGRAWRIGVELSQVTPTDVKYEYVAVEAVTGGATYDDYSYLGAVIGQALRVVINPGGALDAVTIGHISVEADSTTATNVASMNQATIGYVGETAADRIARLCGEQSVALTLVGTAADTEATGPQRVATFLDLINDAADADGGVLYEPRDSLGLVYRTRADLYSQSAALALAYGNLGELTPVDDDQLVRNDVTVSREGGSSARATLDTGALSTAAPPAGVGRYDDSVTLNVAADTQLADIAAWRLHLGTLDETRYPVLALELAASAFVASPALTAAVLALDVGDLLTVSGPPAWLAPDLITALAQGFTETLEPFGYAVAINATPASLWNVFALDSATAGRLDSLYSTLAAGYSAGATTLSVAVAAGRALWTTTATRPGDFPLSLMVAGEEMSCTAISGTSSPQSFTVVRAVNGVSKSQLSGAAVRVARAAVLAL